MNKARFNESKKPSHLHFAKIFTPRLDRNALSTQGPLVRRNGREFDRSFDQRCWVSWHDPTNKESFLFMIENWLLSKKKEASMLEKKCKNTEKLNTCFEAAYFKQIYTKKNYSKGDSNTQALISSIRHRCLLHHSKWNPAHFHL